MAVSDSLDLLKSYFINFPGRPSTAADIATEIGVDESIILSTLTDGITDGYIYKQGEYYYPSAALLTGVPTSPQLNQKWLKNKTLLTPQQPAQFQEKLAKIDPVFKTYYQQFQINHPEFKDFYKYLSRSSYLFSAF